MSLVLFSVARASTCASYGVPEAVASIRGAPFAEASGLAASRVRDGVFFTHGDKGDGSVLLSFDADGEILGEHAVNEANVDWEDLASALCPDRGDGDCLYVGDIGDNDAERAQIAVYVVREPEEGDDKAKVADRFEASYPDGPHDAEALMVHPCTGEVLVVTKDETTTQIFAFPQPLTREPMVLEQVARVEFSPTLTADQRQVTGGDWDRDGERVVLRTGDRLFEWTTDPDDPHGHWTNDPDREIVGTNQTHGEGVAYAGGEIWSIGEDDAAAGLPVDRYACEGEEEGVPCAFEQQRCGCDGAGSGGWVGVVGVWAARRVRRRS